MILRLLVWALLALAPAAATAAEGFAFRTPIVAAPGAPLQRLQLPAAAVVRLVEPGYADLRVLDADGRAVPIALLDAREPAASQRITRLDPLPILGAPGSLTVTGITLRVDPAGASRVVRVDGNVGPATGAVLLGVLFDTRAAKGPATALTLDVDVPAQQPVTFAVEGSTDLRDWQPLAETVVYRSGSQAARAQLPLARAGRYLRVTWRAATPLLAPAGINAALLTTSGPAAASPIVATLTGATLVDAHDLRLVLPFATPVAGIRIVPAGDGLIPVRILGRADDEQPWTLIGDGVAYRLGRKTGAVIALSASYPEIKVEADARTAGFASPPQVELSFEPREIAMMLTGRAPFTLAAGQPGARAAFLPVQALAASAGDADLASLPRASVAAGLAVIASPAADQGADRRTWLLWAVLVAGVTVLGVLAWIAGRKPGPS